MRKWEVNLLVVFISKLQLSTKVKKYIKIRIHEEFIFVNVDAEEAEEECYIPLTLFVDKSAGIPFWPIKCAEGLTYTTE